MAHVQFVEFHGGWEEVEYPPRGVVNWFDVGAVGAEDLVAGETDTD
jgi:hypothetical protein